MSRISGANLTASQRAHVEPRILVALMLDTGTLLVCSGASTIVDPFTFDEYTAVGGFGAIDSVSEDPDLRPNAVRMTLSGIDPALLSEALTEDYQGRECTIKVAFLDTTTLQMVAPAYQLFTGPIEQMVVDLDHNQASITLTAQDEFARWSLPRQMLYTDAQQKQLWSGDNGLNQVVYIQNRQLVWGGKTSAAGASQSPFRRPS